MKKYKVFKIFDINFHDISLNLLSDKLDKGAGLKTIAFKYFGADIQKALKYLDINNKEESLDKECPSFTLIDSKEYYQPELLH